MWGHKIKLVIWREVTEALPAYSSDYFPHIAMIITHLEDGKQICCNID